MPRSTTTKKPERSSILSAVNNPLAFFVLNLLIIEAMLTVVLTFSKLDEAHIWDGFLWMVDIFIGEVLIVTALTIFRRPSFSTAKKSIAPRSWRSGHSKIKSRI